MGGNLSNMNIETNECGICYENMEKNEKIKKWDCTHYFHKNCIKQWNKSCPICRCEILINKNNNNNNNNKNKNNTNILNIESMRKYPNVEHNYLHFYKNQWFDQHCILNNHTMLCVQPYGITMICEDCNTIQTFNCIH